MNTALLTRDNPDLLALEVAYQKFMAESGLAHSLWQKHQNVGVDIAHFRADGAYLGQGAERGIQQYQNMVNYIAANDPDDLLHRLMEDDAFAVEYHDLPTPSGEVLRVSRDLLDSILEIYFLKETLGESYISDAEILDIGAGYGRFAHRFTTAYPDATLLCTDAVAVSSFLCRRYLDFRNESLPEPLRAFIIRLDEIDNFAMRGTELAMNIHSWSECSSAAINWWLDRLVDWNVPYLFLVPHDERWVCVEPDGSIGNFRPLVEAHGYKELRSRSKYPDGIDGLYPEVVYHLFAR